MKMISNSHSTQKYTVAKYQRKKSGPKKTRGGGRSLREGTSRTMGEPHRLAEGQGLRPRLSEI